MDIVTGGSGLLGADIALKLAEMGRKVRVFDLKPPPENHTNIEFVKGNVKDANVLTAAAEGCENIFHLAAQMPQARLTEKGFYDINVGGTKNALNAALKNGLKRFVYASTIEMYGPLTDFPIPEDATKLFTGHYSRNKFICEELLLTAREQHGISVVFLRMPMIFGPGFWHDGTIKSLFRSIKRGWPVPIPGNSDAPWACVSCHDVADAFILASKVPEADGEAFNISAGETPTVKRALIEFIKSVGSSSKVFVLPMWFSKAMVKLIMRFDVAPTPAELAPFALIGGDYDISKAKRILGYDPKVSVVEAMIETYNYLEGGG